jgi:hypothetical protein
MFQAILIIFLFLFSGSGYSYADNLNLQAKAAFEREIVADFSKDVGRDNVIQESRPSKGIEGIEGKRRPDLVTIERDGLCTMWETKSPREAKGKAWFVNHRNDYIASCRSKFTAERDRIKNEYGLSEQAKKAKIECLAWTIVVGCQMKHYADNYKKEWRLPEGKSNSCETIHRIGLIAPAGKEISNKSELYENVDAIKCAFDKLGIKGEIKTKGNKVYASFEMKKTNIIAGLSGTGQALGKQRD